jgi:hypothetical protein
MVVRGGKGSNQFPRDPMSALSEGLEGKEWQAKSRGKASADAGPWEWVTGRLPSARAIASPEIAIGRWCREPGNLCEPAQPRR